MAKRKADTEVQDEEVKDEQVNKEEKVMKTLAKSLFLLTDDELAGLSVEVVGRKKLFKYRELEAKARQKYGGENGLALERTRRQERAAKRRRTAERISQIPSRRVEIIDALKAVGLELRPDSKLCQRYIEDGVGEGWTVAKIVRRMAEMRFLHDHTKYTQILDSQSYSTYESAKEYYTDHRGKERYYDPRKDYERKDDAENDRRVSEAQAVRRVGGWPKVWPWLT